MGNIAESQVARGSSAFSTFIAKEDQILAGYNADKWIMANLKKGDTLFGGLPGQSAYYTTEKTLIESQIILKNYFGACKLNPTLFAGIGRQ